MTSYALAIKRLYGQGIVRVAAKHNLREIAAEIGADGHIDPARIADNFILRGPNTAEAVVKLDKSLMDAARVNFKKTSVRALELMFTLPAQTIIDPREYFERATSWAESHFKVIVLSSIVHLDEGAPHAHVLLSPLVNGRMGGSDLHGGQAKLWAMQKSFHDQVGTHYGLPYQFLKQRHSAHARVSAILLARASLQTNSALTDAVIDALLKPHAKDPEALLLALSLPMPTPKAKGKSFAARMTAPCKPELNNPIGKTNDNPIGIVTPIVSENSQPYTCVGIEILTVPISPQSGQQPSANEQPTAPSAPAAHQRQPLSEAKHDAPANAVGPAKIAPTATDAQHCQADIAPIVDANTPAWAASEAPALSNTVAHHTGTTGQHQAIHSTHTARADGCPCPSTEGDYQRERDDEQPTKQWSEELGEFVTPPIKASSKSR